MGVNGLWKIIEPAHRPVKLETLAKKRLAVDASIWIYQFLKAVRDKEGNALRSSHIVGFFRRICKLLFHGIKPVFVFDGGAPALKRRTIAGRKQRREGRREDASRTAEKLLALQIKRLAEDQVRGRLVLDTELPDAAKEEKEEREFVYVGDLEQAPQQRKQNRRHKKTDQYELPEIKYDLNSLGRPGDPRIMSIDELNEYTKLFEGMDDISFYDLSSIDFSSAFFQSLPETDRYRILNAARLKSRLRMGYSKEQLNEMFPDRMAFSRFQVERVMHRNELSQRLMNIQGRGEDGNLTLDISRVAGERGREYALLRNDEAHGGWSMGFAANKREIEGEKKKPIVVEAIEKKTDQMDEEEEGFEDVPIEGLNRLSKLKRKTDTGTTEGLLCSIETQGPRQVIYRSRIDGAKPNGTCSTMRREPAKSHTSTLFLIEDTNGDDWDDITPWASGTASGDYPFKDGEMQDIEVPQGSQGPVEKGEVKYRENGFMGAPAWDPLVEGDDDCRRAIVNSEQRDKIGKRNRKPLSVINMPREIVSLDLSKSYSFLNQPLQYKEAAGEGGPLAQVCARKDLCEKGMDANITEKKQPPWFSQNDQRNTGDEVTEAQVTQTQTPDYTQSEGPKTSIIDSAGNARETLDSELMMSFSGQQSQPGAKIPPKLVKYSPPKITNTPPPLSKKSPLQFEKTGSVTYNRSSDTAAPVVITTDCKQKLPSSTTAYMHSPTLDTEEEEEGEVFSFSLDDGTEPSNDLFNLEDAEEEDLFQQMDREGQEHARFAAELTGQLPQEAIAFENEIQALRTQQKKDRRDADEVTQIMVEECQSLLTLFGLPYITAPMEAEAQCAELVRLGLVDGIVTDDSDVFLFGGTKVYRHMFNDKETVQCYLSQDLKKEFALDQRRLIDAAHLLGSDYTEGIHSVGPVTAIEVLAEFADSGGLAGFKEWWTRVQQGSDDSSKTQSKFRKKFRKSANKIFLPPSFPDSQVDDAYIHAEVDRDPCPFEWGIPDLDGLRQFLMANLGWSQHRTDQVLVPVIRDMNKKITEGAQTNITRFFDGSTGAGAFAPKVKLGVTSRRMEHALENLVNRTMKSHNDDLSSQDRAQYVGPRSLKATIKTSYKQTQTITSGASGRQGNGRIPDEFKLHSRSPRPGRHEQEKLQDTDSELVNNSVKRKSAFGVNIEASSIKRPRCKASFSRKSKNIDI